MDFHRSPSNAVKRAREQMSMYDYNRGFGDAQQPFKKQLIESHYQSSRMPNPRPSIFSESNPYLKVPSSHNPALKTIVGFHDMGFGSGDTSDPLMVEGMPVFVHNNWVPIKASNVDITNAIEANVTKQPVFFDTYPITHFTFNNLVARDKGLEMITEDDIKMWTEMKNIVKNINYVKTQYMTWEFGQIYVYIEQMFHHNNTTGTPTAINKYMWAALFTLIYPEHVMPDDPTSMTELHEKYYFKHFMCKGGRFRLTTPYSCRQTIKFIGTNVTPLSTSANLRETVVDIEGRSMIRNFWNILKTRRYKSKSTYNVFASFEWTWRKENMNSLVPTTILPIPKPFLKLEIENILSKTNRVDVLQTFYSNKNDINYTIKKQLIGEITQPFNERQNNRLWPESINQGFNPNIDTDDITKELLTGNAEAMTFVCRSMLHGR